MFLKIILTLTCSYLIGSISFAYLMGNILRGIDLREYGDGNLGAGNAIHMLGRVPGIIVGLADAGKGVGAMLLARVIGVPLMVTLLCGLLAIVGHNWSVFFGFHGGQGVSTSLGVLLYCIPWMVAIGVVIWPLLAFLKARGIISLKRYRTFGWQAIFCLFPFLGWWLGVSQERVILTIGIAAIGAMKQIPTIGELRISARD